VDTDTQRRLNELATEAKAVFDLLPQSKPSSNIIYSREELEAAGQLAFTHQ